MTEWRPTASLRALRARADFYRYVRGFFDARGVLEVSTPVLARHGVTDPHVPCIAVPGYGWLQPSPEYHMKRLLAAGSGPIWQLAPVFRDGESGRRHNPEFTLLEWYRPGFDLGQLIDECVELLTPVLALARVRRVAFRTLFREVTGLDPVTAPLAALRTAAGDGLPADLDRAALVDWLMATRVEAALPRDELVVVDRFPGWAAALAERRPDEDGVEVAQRFEIYGGGYELANGYLELRDAAEQAQRFRDDRRRRVAAGLPDMEADPRLLAALEAGLPPCAGVALGVERILMVQLGTDEIADVLAFPAARA